MRSGRPNKLAEHGVRKNRISGRRSPFHPAVSTAAWDACRLTNKSTLEARSWDKNSTL